MALTIRQGAILLTLSVFSSIGAAEPLISPEPLQPLPTQSLSVDMMGAMASRVNDPNTSISQAPFEVNFNYLQRRPLQNSNLFWILGLREDYFHFDNRDHFPVEHLQSYAAQFGLDYTIGSDVVASLTLRPGFYFETEPTLSAWDIPLDFVTGIPIHRNVNGVIGVSMARFYHQPIPVFGISWEITSHARLDLVYPEPALVMNFPKNLVMRLGGTLVGGGFRLDSNSAYSKVEYFEYRVGPTLSKTIRPGMKLVGEAGYIMGRQFNFFDNSIRFDSNGAPYLRLGLELSR